MNKFTRWFFAAATLIAACVGVLLAAYQQGHVEVEAKIRLQKHAAAPPAPVECHRALRVVNVRSDDVLNLRAEPSHFAEIRIGIPANARVVDLRERNGVWRRIEFRTDADRLVGFVNGAYVTNDGVICPKHQPTT